MDEHGQPSTASGTVVYDSLDAFLAAVEKRAYIIALNTTRDSQKALDIVQDAMYSMVKNYANKAPEQWAPLFFKVLDNRITDQHRKRGFGRFTQWFGNSNSSESSHSDNSEIDAVDQLMNESASPVDSTEAEQLNEQLQHSLGKLSIKQREVLVLRLWQGMSVKETATAMGITEGTVKTHLSRALIDLREQLSEFYQP